MIDIKEGVELFNNEEFFAAHDYFEELWIKAESQNRLFFQGMVQLAVGCYHLICKNYKGSLSQFTRGISKLEQYPHEYNGVNLGHLLIQIKPFKQQLEYYFEDKVAEVAPVNLPKVVYQINYKVKE
ncbi:MAG: DUF309 domain-containing protein [Melioribacteraceae bacterium]|nr:DUF309 domain-containing protein [Melioribacteraceae bacterium]MCF8266002.1 DUF309 domain-containing protein [Melioribacteraceae bacterium]MCF8414152.1 DUF309 domain-containing protein [Melioribacteraceae bacterium]